MVYLPLFKTNYNKFSRLNCLFYAHICYIIQVKVHEQILVVTKYELRSSLQVHVGSFEDIWFHEETAFTSLQYIKARVVQVSPFAPGVQLLPFRISLLVLASLQSGVVHCSKTYVVHPHIHQSHPTSIMIQRLWFEIVQRRSLK